MGAGDADGEALGTDGGEALATGGGEGLATSDGVGLSAGVGAGVGRSPIGSGPTKTRAARMPAATRMPASRPDRIATPVFMPAEGTSTSVPGRVHWAADRMPIPWAPSSTRFANGSSRRS